VNVADYALQLPGPRGSPQVPHALGAGASRVRPTLTTDSSRSRSVDPQPGHDAAASERTSASNSRAHARQVYS